MTLTERLQTVAAGAKAFWYVVLPVAALFALALLARACNGEREARAELIRVQEQAEIRAAGLELIEGAEQAALQIELEAARKGSADFAEALALAQAALKARPTIVVRASTGPVPVETPEDPDPPTKPDGTPAERPCLLRPGDQGEVTVTEAVLETEAGNRVLVGAAEAYRVSPEPRLRLFGGSFRTEITEAKAEPLPLASSPGWGAGLMAGLGTSGVLGSAVVATPPVFGDHLFGVGVVSAGPDQFAAQVGFVYRP
jgi:hypothetical protein